MKVRNAMLRNFHLTFFGLTFFALSFSGVFSAEAYSSEEELCFRKPINSISYYPAEINTRSYMRKIERYLDTYECGKFEDDASTQVETMLHFAVLTHTMQLVPDLNVNAGFKRFQEIDKIKTRLHNLAKKIEKTIDWDDVYITPEHYSFVSQFFCDLSSSLEGKSCIITKEHFLSGSNEIYPQERKRFIKEFVKSL